MSDERIKELTEVIQSSSLNFLIGAGCSQPFLPLLFDIEKKLNDAKPEDKEPIYKEYLEKVMLPNKGVVEKSETSSELQSTKEDYEYFLKIVATILLHRKSTILSKQANIFTTNIDIFLETALEELKLEYNDGFSGKFTPTFGIANYKKTIQQRSLHFDHISEIPIFNILKLHGSLTWQYADGAKEAIALSHKLEHFDEELLKKNGDDFTADYSKLLIINPENTKNLESVLNVYYSELLRLYSSELEKENAVLFIMGFSMEDQHIKEITLRAAKSNPTLRIYYFCYSKKDKSGVENSEVFDEKLLTGQHPNISILVPPNDKKEERLSIRKISENFFAKVLPFNSINHLNK